MAQRFNKLLLIKNNLHNKKYTTGDELANDIYSFINEFWAGPKYLVNEDLYNQDLTELSSFHYELLKQVSNIIDTNNSANNSKLINNELNCYKILREAEHGVITNKIYFLNKNYENIIIGDLHSDYNSLTRALKVSDFYNKYISKQAINLVFVGDYVDRGHSHLQLVELLLILQFLFANNVFLLRGNHDGGVMHENDSFALTYRVPDKDQKEMYFSHYLLTLSRKNSTFNKQMIHSYLNFFNKLPYVALILNEDKVIMIVHGGIPRPRYFSEDIYEYINCLADITNNDNVDFLGSVICNNLVWSDPRREGRELRLENRRFSYSQAEYESFKNKLNIDLLIRGHEAVEEGYKYHFNDNLITIFSSGGIFGNTINKQSNYHWVKPKVVKLKDGEVNFI